MSYNPYNAAGNFPSYQSSNYMPSQTMGPGLSPYQAYQQQSSRQLVAASASQSPPHVTNAYPGLSSFVSPAPNLGTLGQVRTSSQNPSPLPSLQPPSSHKGVEIAEGPPVDSNDYSKGEARHHHRLYIETGDIVIQAEMAIFKVHRHFLMTHSSVLEDLLTVPTGSLEKEGTDEKPIVLSDKANGWAWLLNSFYRDDPLLSFEYDWGQTVAVLEVANKYCMKKLEDTLVRRIQGASTKDALMYLLQAARIVDSRDLYVQAIRGLAASDPPLTIEEAREVGIQAYFDINACKSGQFSG